MEKLKEYLHFIELELKKLHLEGSPKELYEPIRYILSLGGKRIRPLLTLLASEAFGGKLEEVKYAALSIELFHNFTLMHDDIMDNAPLRRNKPTVHTKWNENIAILSGDAMFVLSQLLMLKTPKRSLHACLELFNRTAVEVCEGQQLDMNFENQKNVTIPAYINMISLKTAVLLAASLKIGAIIAGANESDAQLIYEYGKNLGIAFQLQDDILDVYADPEKFGKQVGGDIIANKKTFLLLKALELSKLNSYKHDELNMWLQATSEYANEKVEAVINIYNFLGVKDLAEREVAMYFNRALEAIERITLPLEQKQGFMEFAKVLMNREI